MAASGDLVVSGGVDGGIVVWSWVTGFQLQKFALHAATIRSVSFDKGAGPVRLRDVWEAHAWQRPCRGSHCLRQLPELISSCRAPHAAGARVAASDGSGVISGWDVGRGALLAAAPAHEQAATDCRWGPGGDALVSCGYDGHVAVLRVSRGREIRTKYMGGWAHVVLMA